MASSRLRAGGTRSCGCIKAGGLPQPTYIDGASPEMLAAAKPARKDTTSAVPGVAWRAGEGLWRASNWLLQDRFLREQAQSIQENCG